MVSPLQGHPTNDSSLTPSSGGGARAMLSKRREVTDNQENGLAEGPQQLTESTRMFLES
jgi:hypothetical protein